MQPVQVSRLLHYQPRYRFARKLGWSDMEKVLQAWLRNMGTMMTGCTQAVVLTGPPGKGPYNRASLWPDKPPNPAELEHLAQLVLVKKQTVLKTRHRMVEKTGEPLDALASPLILKGQLFGAVVLEMTHRSPQMQQMAVQHLQAGAKWLETLLQLNDSKVNQQLAHLIDLVAAGLDHRRFREAATEVANELADRMGCRRVSLGFLHFNRIRVEAVSHCVQVDRRVHLVRAIEDAMHEALDQAAIVVYPDADDTSVLVTRFHAQLAQAQQGAAICTLPLVKNGKAIGALLLERSPDRPFDVGTVEQCARIGLLLGPVLATRRREERSLAARILESLQEMGAKLFGPRHLPLKTAVGLSAVMIFCLSLASGNLRISCDSVLEADISRVIVAPQHGYIAGADVRAGDLVRKGDLLATLDDNELRLELRKWQSQRAQLIKEYRQAMARFDRAEIAILKAKQDQAEAQLHLVEQQLSRTTLVAPFAGMVVKGDLSQALGSPVTPGQVLFEVAPADKYRVVLKVDDRDIGLIAPGQPGRLKLSGIPDLTITTRIDRITPVSTIEKGRNCFRVEAVMESQSDLMRPGMEGITKIEIGRAKLIWIWTRPLLNWLRLLVWTRLP